MQINPPRRSFWLAGLLAFLLATLSGCNPEKASEAAGLSAPAKRAPQDWTLVVASLSAREGHSLSDSLHLARAYVEIDSLAPAELLLNRLGGHFQLADQCDSLAASFWFTQACWYFKKNDFGRSYQIWAASLPRCGRWLPADDHVQGWTLLGYLGGQVQGKYSPLMALERAYFLADSLPDLSPQALATARIQLAQQYIVENDRAQARHLLTQNQAFLEKTLPGMAELQAKNLLNMGLCESRDGDFEAALDAFERVPALLQEVPEPEASQLRAYYYTRLASVYHGSGDPLRAERFCRQALPHLGQGVARANMLQKLGRISWTLNEPEEAFASLREADSLYPPNHANLWHLRENMGSFFLEAGKADSARKYFLLARDFLLQFPEVDSTKLSSSYYFLARLASEHGQQAEAQAYLRQAQALLVGETGEQRLEQAFLAQAYAQSLAREGKTDKALARYNQLLAMLIPGKDPYDLQPEDLEESLSPSLLATILLERASIHLLQYQRSGDENFLIYSLHQYELTRHLYQQLRENLAFDDSKRQIQQQFEEISQGSIQAMTLAAEVFQDPQWEREAFKQVERNRALLLLEALQRSGSRSFPQVPPRFQQRDQALLQQKASLETALFYLKMEGESSPLRDSLEEELIVVHQACDSLKQISEEQYPSYYRWRYDLPVLNLSRLQASLGSERAMLSYFIGQEKLFIFLVRQDTLLMHTQPLPVALQQWVREFRAGICDYYLEKGQHFSQNEARYQQASWALYQVLVEPVAPLLPSRLLIIPHGILSYLPFEALLTAEAAERELPSYLLQQHLISYTYSATLWDLQQNQPESEAPARTFLAVAPSFPPQTADGRGGQRQLRQSLGPLKYNQDEAQAIHQMLGGQKLLGKEATVERFMELADQYRILHLSSHAWVDDEEPLRSFIAFYGEGDSVVSAQQVAKGVSGLYLADLMSLQLKSDLVFLSGCETGMGRYYEGEGMASLAWGFSHAGARSILMTLWQVDDALSKELSERYYDYLKEGNTKDQALHRAKLEFAEKKNYPPFYWAGVVAYGDQRPLDLPSNPYAMIGWGLLVFFVASLGMLGGMWVYRRLQG